MRRPEASTQLLLVFLVASFAAVACGAVVCALSGIPATLWLRNLAGWLVGALLAVTIAMTVRPRAAAYFVPAAVLVLAASFLSPGQLSVHRWVAVGPVSLNAAMLVLPAAVVALAAGPRPNALAWLSAFVGLAIMVAQPDAAQAAAFGVAIAVVAGRRAQGRARLALAAIALVLAAAAWFQPDPLAPVPEVEGIIGLALQHTILLAALAIAALAATAAAPTLATQRGCPDIRTAGWALSVLLAFWMLTPIFRAFPVPIVGIGLSPILGAWAGVGMLAGLMRRHDVRM